MYQDIIKEICDEKDISYKLISNNYLIMLQKDNKTKFIWGHKFDLNNHAIGLVLDDKYATYDLIDKIIEVCDEETLNKIIN